MKIFLACKPCTVFMDLKKYIELLVAFFMRFIYFSARHCRSVVTCDTYCKIKTNLDVL